MAITNEYPYVTLRRLATMSDEEFLQLSRGDILRMEEREEQFEKPELAKELNWFEFVSVERRELLENLNLKQFYEAAKESIMRPENGQGSFFEIVTFFLKERDGTRREIAEGKWDHNMETARKICKLHEQDYDDLVRVGFRTDGRAGADEAYNAVSPKYRGDFAQWRRDLVSKNKNN